MKIIVPYAPCPLYHPPVARSCIPFTPPPKAQATSPLPFFFKYPSYHSVCSTRILRHTVALVTLPTLSTLSIYHDLIIDLGASSPLLRTWGLLSSQPSPSPNSQLSTPSPHFSVPTRTSYISSKPLSELVLFSPLEFNGLGDQDLKVGSCSALAATQLHSDLGLPESFRRPQLLYQTRPGLARRVKA